MKKIPTLFKRVFSPDHKTKTILPEVTPGCEAVLEGRCIPTVKWDGACCAIINGEIYKRYDAKIGKDGKQKQPPEGAIPCQPAPDAITGHWPHWVKCEVGNPSDKYFLEAFVNWKEHTVCSKMWIDASKRKIISCEAIGVHWQSNPYRIENDTLEIHGDDIVETDCLVNAEGNITLESIRDHLSRTTIEGIVFWLDGQPLCKIKRSDFGFPWPVKKP